MFALINSRPFIKFLLLVGISFALFVTQYKHGYAAIAVDKSLSTKHNPGFLSLKDSENLLRVSAAQISATTAISLAQESALPANVCPTTAIAADPGLIMPQVADLTTSVSQWIGSSLANGLNPNSELTERMNILLLGSDSRPGQKYGHTDTMILLSIDPATKSVGLLSIPRDLWVIIPEQGENRINNAYRWGQIKEYPGGGPALVSKTIESNLGIPVHHYVLVNFETFAQFIDIFGGVELCAPETIDAASYYGYTASEINAPEYYSFVPLSSIEALTATESIDPNSDDVDKGYAFLYLETGWHTLDGYTALRYARSRASVTADFARVKRQQAVLMALRKKVLHTELITKIPELWETMGNVIETDLQLVDIIQLAYLTIDIPTANIQMRAISHKQTINHTTATGARVLLPQRAEIQIVVEELFGEATPTAPLTQAELEINPPDAGISSPQEVSLTAIYGQSNTLAWEN